LCYYSIIEPEQYGEIKEVCGKTYLFGIKEVSLFISSTLFCKLVEPNFNKVSWEENWKTCCAIGMSPVLFDTEDEMTCMMKSTHIISMFIRFLDFDFFRIHK
jgi:hypothetical protein